MNDQFRHFFLRKFRVVAIRMLRYIKANPALSMTRAMLGFGTALLGMVFWSIGELPEVDVASVVPLLVIIAVGGLLVTASLAMFALAGGVIARVAVAVPDPVGRRWVLVMYLLPSFLVAGSLSGFAFAFPTWPKYNSSIPTWLTVVGPVIAAGRIVLVRRSFDGWKKALGAWMSLAWTSAALTLLASLLLVNLLPATTYERSSIRDLGITFALWAAYFGLLVVLARRVQAPHQVGVYLAGSFVAALLLMAVSGGWMAVSHAMVKRTGWGNVPARLFVTDRGCEILNRSIGQEVCRLKPGASAQYVCPVLIRSRIGSPVYLSVSPISASGSWPDYEKLSHVSLPNEDLIVPQRIAARPGGAASTEVHENVVTYLSTAEGDESQWLVEQCGFAEAPHLPTSASAAVKDVR